ncbi:MAG: winged helix-turn-helix domain-containing protein [Anaerolineales bacterium]|nr:winged helix-turn-helix domain-containing protein [Anaerolineales bacterium]MCA9931438.1 winged helix-turn-helix domain-containing protein [Anaerolineales bacterium]
MVSSIKRESFYLPNLEQTVQSLLEKQEYLLAAELLLKAHQLTIEQGADGLAGTLLAAYQICLNCHQHQQNALTYYDVYQKAILHESELRQQLNAVLVSLIDSEAGNPQLSLTLTQKNSFSPSPPTLWKRIQFLLTGRMLPDEQTRPFPPHAPPKLTIPVEPLSSPAAPPLAAEPNSIPDTQNESPYPTLTVYCLGAFRVYEDDHSIDEWSNGKGKAIFKYLIMHRQQPVHKEMLMDLFWPDADPDAARNNLNVAIYGLRKALRNGYPDFSHILFQQDCYRLNPDLQIWVDSEAFDKHIQSAQELERLNQEPLAIMACHAAEELYQGDLLMEDRYEEWILPLRQKQQDNYLKLLDTLSKHYFDNQNLTTCITICHKILAIEPCREETHRQLMQIYCRQQQHYLAIRQYHQCAEALKEELDVLPAPVTTQLFEKIRRREPI